MALRPENVIREIRLGLGVGLSAVGLVLVEEARSRTSSPATGRDPPFDFPRSRSGQLSSSFFANRFPGQLRLRFGNTSKQALFTELGTGLGRMAPVGDEGRLAPAPGRKRIKPRTAKFLKFEDIATGETIFTRSVRGAEPRPTLMPVIRQNKDRILRTLVRNFV